MNGPTRGFKFNTDRCELFSTVGCILSIDLNLVCLFSQYKASYNKPYGYIELLYLD